MIPRFEQFSGKFLTFSTAFTQQLDRVIRALSEETSPHATTVAYTFTDTDQIDSLQVNATAAALTITLPSPTGNRRRRVIKTDVSANAVTLAAAGTGLINGSSTFVLVAQYNYVTVEPTGTGWLIVGS